MNTKMMKILTIVFTVIALILMLGTVVLANNNDSKGDGEITPGSLSATYSGTADITNIGQKIMGIVNTIGTIVAVVVLMVLGIKYMMGSAEEKAEYKKTMIPYIIGAILIFGATTIATMVYNFSTGLKDTTTTSNKSSSISIQV